ncbi:MAG: hypothetical protein LBO82_04705 [Synergistaceae bacterium]|jgi:hypothetical protein|nr:hypothetical protein [Synergistaceae bacterium]
MKFLTSEKSHRTKARLFLEARVFPEARLFLGVCLFCLALTESLSGTAFSANFRGFPAEPKPLRFTADEIASMIQMNPDFSTYPGSDGVIWLKQLDYAFAPGGGVERRSLWIVLGREGLASRWLNWNVPVPRGGEAEILEAAVYSPGEGRKIGDMLRKPFSPSLQDGAIRTAVFTDLPDEFILVVAYRELFPERLSIEDLVWLSEPLPVWEELVRVTVPDGHLFYYTSNAGAEPEKRKSGDSTLYEWRAINTAADAWFSLRENSREYVAFAMREGPEAAPRLIKNLEAAPAVPAAPDSARRTLDGANAKNIGNFLRWLYEQPKLVLPDGASREIPAKAPWTAREKLLLASRWLADAGVNARLFWRLAYPPAEGKPFCEAVAVSPVLAVAEPKAPQNVTYCDMAYPPRFGENPAFLWGRTVYGVTADGKLEERTVPAAGASVNRLSALFDLRLDDDGILSGTVKITARRAWKALLSPPRALSGGGGSKSAPASHAALLREFFPQPLRYRDIQLKETDREGELLVTLSGIQAIKDTGGRGVLVSLPSLLPRCFSTLTGPFPCALNFPFVVEARLTLALPSNTENVTLPAPSEGGAEKVKYSVSYKLGKRKVLTAEARISVGTAAVTESAAPVLNTALQAWQTFMTKNLPIRLKPGP